MLTCKEVETAIGHDDVCTARWWRGLALRFHLLMCQDCRRYAEGGFPPGSVYTVGTDAGDNRLALFLIQTQMNRGSGRIIPLGNLSSKMKEAIKTADAYLKANLRNLGITHDLKGYDFNIQAINLN
jgi:predicted ATP-dependent Lon-type protease